MARMSAIADMIRQLCSMIEGCLHAHRAGAG